jgi:hypothetical protein
LPDEFGYVVRDTQGRIGENRHSTGYGNRTASVKRKN